MFCGGGEVAVIGTQVAAGGLDGGMVEDVLKNVERDARRGGAR